MKYVVCVYAHVYICFFQQNFFLFFKINNDGDITSSLFIERAQVVLWEKGTKLEAVVLAIIT